jgi:hypothetical protein
MDEKPRGIAQVDGPAVGLEEGDCLDIEAHVRLEAGLIDSSRATDAISAAHTSPPISPPHKPPKAWQTIKRFFGLPES